VSDRLPIRVLFVCLGNICRSPTAEAVFAQLVRGRELEGWIEVDSAGTGSWHVGEPADPRARQAAARRGIELRGRARTVEPSDLERFDQIVAMDRSVERTLEGLARSAGVESKIRLLPGGLEVPDPYHGSEQGFERVLDLLEAGCEQLLDELEAQLRARHDGDAA